jgi:hypothetical protein
MNLPRIALASAASSSVLCGWRPHCWTLAGDADEVLKYLNISRSHGGSKAPSPSVGTRVPGDRAAVLYSMLYRAGSGVISGAALEVTKPPKPPVQRVARRLGRLRPLPLLDSTQLTQSDTSQPL